MYQRKLLIVVDYQNDFVDGALGFPKAKAMEDKLANKIEEHIKNGGVVMFTYDTHMDDYLETREGKALPVKHCIVGTEGWKLYGKIQDLLEKYRATDKMCRVAKTSFGLNMKSSQGEDLYGLLNHVSDIEICGIVTNMCVLSVAVTIQAVTNYTPITVDASLCASFNDELHEKALDVMEGLQINVINREVQND